MVIQTDSFKVMILMFVVLITGALSTVEADQSGTEKAGDVLTILVPVAGYGLTFLNHDNLGRNQFYVSCLVNLGVTYGLDAATSNERSKNQDNKGSFPSQHTSIAFQGASFIHGRYGLKYALPAYAGAAFVGYSRLQADKHYPEDVIAGAAIGFLSSYLFTSPYCGVQITPSACNGNYFLNFFTSW